MAELIDSTKQSIMNSGCCNEIFILILIFAQVCSKGTCTIRPDYDIFIHRKKNWVNFRMKWW